MTRMTTPTRWLPLLLGILGFTVAVLSPCAVARASFEHEPLLYTYPRETHPDIGPVNDILQTHDGTLWFAGRRGILEYDGYRFIRHDNEDGLNANYVYRLRESEDGTLYACTWRGLHRYDPSAQRWFVHPVKSDQPVRDLAFIPGGFAIAADDGVSLVRGLGYYRLPLDSHRPAVNYNGPAHDVRYEPGRNLLWITSELHGLVRYKLHTAWEYFTWLNPDEGAYFEEHGHDRFMEHFGRSPEDLKNFIAADHAIRDSLISASKRQFIPPGESRNVLGMTWPGLDEPDGDPMFVTLDGLYRVNGNEIRIERQLVETVGRHPHLIQSQQGGLYVATMQGAWSLSEHDTTFFSVEKVGGRGVVSSMYRDRDGILWIGNEQGWIRKHIHPSLTQQWANHFGRVGEFRSGIQDGRDQVIVVGSHGIVRVGKDKYEILFELDPSEGVVIDAVRGPHNTVLVATTSRLVALRNGRAETLLESGIANSIRHPFFTTESGVWYVMDWRQYFWDGHQLQNRTLIDNFMSITAFADGPRGSLFMGSWAGLLEYREPMLNRYSFHARYTADLSADTLRWVTLEDHPTKPFPDESILAMELDQDSVLWCGTLNGGILRFSGDDLQLVEPVSGELHGSYANSMTASDGRIYFFGSVQPAMVEDGELRVLTDVNTLDAVIKSASEDAAGRIYFSTSRGILVVEDNELRFIIGSGLGVGLGSLVGVYTMGEQTICLVLSDRLVYLDLERYLGQDTAAHLPMIRSVTTSDGRFLPGEAVVVPADQRSISLEFSLPYFFNEDMHLYSWRLTGLEPEFEPFQSRADVTYDRLPPGEYQFELRARDSIGRVASMATPLQLTVPHRFYETRAFAIMVVLLTGVIILVIVRISIARTQRRNLQLEAHIQERTQELRAALEELEKKRDAEVESARLRAAQRMAVTISHEFNNPLAILKAIAQMLGLYKADKLPTEVNDLIRRIPPVVDRLGELTRKMHHIAEVRVTEYGHGVKMLDVTEGETAASDALDVEPRPDPVDKPVQQEHPPIS